MWNILQLYEGGAAKTAPRNKIKDSLKISWIELIGYAFIFNYEIDNYEIDKFPLFETCDERY